MHSTWRIVSTDNTNSVNSKPKNYTDFSGCQN